MKAIAHLAKNFARRVVVEAAEGDAVVEQHAVIREVDDVYGGGDTFSKCLAQRHAEIGVVREVRAGEFGIGIAVGKAGAVIKVKRTVGIVRQRGIHADIQRVSLVMVERSVVESLVTLRRCDGNTDQATRNWTALLRQLIRICQMGLAEAPQGWRAQG